MVSLSFPDIFLQQLRIYFETVNHKNPIKNTASTIQVNPEGKLNLLIAQFR